MSRIIAVIPARMGSTRFPGKPLARIRGQPMIRHVYEGTRACPLLDEVIVATCDAEIAECARGFGATAVMTSASHQRATDRVAEATAADTAGIVVMVQGDEPMVRPSMIETAIRFLRANPGTQCVNLVARIASRRELSDPNTIKVAVAQGRTALYFSRSVIPWSASPDLASGHWHKQVCVIAFTQAALQKFPSLPGGPLELAESVDMLRFLENGIPVHVVPTDVRTQAVDTPADLRRVARRMPPGWRNP